MKIKALNDELLILPAKKKERTAGGIVLPSTVSDDDTVGLGEVLDIGDGMLLNDGQYLKPSINVGDEVLYDPRSAVKFKHDDIVYHFVKIHALHGKFAEEK